jgi:hypothetical protein
MKYDKENDINDNKKLKFTINSMNRLDLSDKSNNEFIKMLNSNDTLTIIDALIQVTLLFLSLLFPL